MQPPSPTALVSPAAHATQISRPGDGTEPAGHGTQNADPFVEYIPRPLHSRHAVPSSLLAVPARQLVQVLWIEAPTAALLFPGGQREQSSADCSPVIFENVPAAHGAQWLSDVRATPTNPNMPLAQGVHSGAPPLDQVPSVQMWHASLPTAADSPATHVTQRSRSSEGVLPAGHLEHQPDPSSEYSPSPMQSTQSVRLLLLTLPPSHTSQSDSDDPPGVGRTLPLGHVLHIAEDDAPCERPKVPDSQGRHVSEAFAPTVTLNRPIGHMEHVERSVVPKDPASQSRHSLSADAPIVLRNVPSSQKMHSLAPGSGLNFPTGQEVQLDFCASAKLPTSHIVLTPSTQACPASQMSHFAASFANLPPGHLRAMSRGSATMVRVEMQ